jgi:O-antigen chain-terminating methyltransferase
MGNSSSDKKVVGRLMDRIRTDIERRRAIQPGLTDHVERVEIQSPTRDTNAAAPETSGARADLPERIRFNLADPRLTEPPSIFKFTSEKQYNVEDLVGLNDRQFIDFAYRAILLRPPDQDGFSTYLSHLRSGTSKEEILYILRESAEGRVAGITVKGLSRRIFWMRASRLPVVGGLVALGIALWNFPKVERKRRTDEGRFIAFVEQSHDNLERSILLANRALRDLEHGYGELTNYAASKAGHDVIERFDSTIRRITESMDNLVTSDKGKATTSDVTILRQAHAELHSQLANEQKSLHDVRSALAEVRNAQYGRPSAVDLATLKQAFAALKEELEIDRKADHKVHAVLAELRTLNESRAAAADLASLYRAHSSLSDQFESDHESLQEVRVAISTVSAGLNAAENTLASLELSRSEVKIAIDRAIQEVHAHLDLHTEPFISRIEVQAASAEFKAATDATLDSFGNDLVRLAATKVDIVDLERTRRDLQATAEVIRTEAKSGIEAVSHNISHAISSVTLSKVDGEILQTALTDFTKKSEIALKDLNERLALLTETKADLGSVERAAAQMTASLESTRQEGQEALERTAKTLSGQAHDLKVNLLDQERRLMFLLSEARKRLPLPLSTKQIEKLSSEEDHLLDSMYARFEDRFRGTRADIKSYQTGYLPYIREAKAGSKERPIIDLGCGRGEWLEVLQDEGLSAQGADKNRVFLETCRELNLSVVEEDALTLLQSKKTQSVGAVTSFHLIEHLHLKTFIAILDESLRVLKSGGVLILETPNPENILVGACNFYYDPTHIRPLPPQSTRFLLEARGFVNVDVLNLHPNPSFEFLKHEIPRLAPLFSGGQDYALVARKA